jgi:hypothetical protein
MAKVIAIDDIRIRRAARPKLKADLEASVDLESKKRIERTRAALLDALKDLVLLEGGETAVEWTEKALDQLKMGMQP